MEQPVDDQECVRRELLSREYLREYNGPGVQIGLHRLPADHVCVDGYHVPEGGVTVGEDCSDVFVGLT